MEVWIIKSRQSNFELLRILAMMMIITLHYFNGRQPEMGSANQAVYYIFESLCICGVNLFVMLTGYFSVRQKDIVIRKIVDILVLVAFWGFVGYVLCVMVGWSSFDLKQMIKDMIPTLFGQRWFVKAYLILLLLLPFINRTLISLTKKGYIKLLIVISFLFFIWPSFLPNPPVDDYGYGFVHLICIYSISVFLSRFVDKTPSKSACLLGYIVCAGLIFLVRSLGEECAWAYNFPLVVMEALFLFLLFIKVRINSPFINKIAACSFGVYLLHTNYFFNHIGYDLIFHAKELTNGNPMLYVLSIVSSVIFFYCIGTLLEIIRKKLFAYTVDRLLDKIPFINKKILIESVEIP